MARSKENVWEADKVETWSVELPSKDQIFEGIIEAATEPASSKKKSPTKSKSTESWEVTKEEKEEIVWTAKKPTKDEIFLADKQVIWDEIVLAGILPLPTNEVIIDGVKKFLYYPIPESLAEYTKQLTPILKEWSRSIENASSRDTYQLPIRGEPFNWHYQHPVIRLYQINSLPSGDVDFAIKVVKKYYPNIVVYTYPNLSVERKDFAQLDEYDRVRSSPCTTFYFKVDQYKIDHVIAKIFDWVKTMFEMNQNMNSTGSTAEKRLRVWQNNQEEVLDPFLPPDPPKPTKEPIKRKSKSVKKTIKPRTRKPKAEIKESSK